MASGAKSFRGRRPKGSDPRNQTVGCSVTQTEQAEVHRALEVGGFRYPADGVRSILFAYCDSARVREVIAEVLPTLKSA